jgi:hypothetical protein
MRSDEPVRRVTTPAGNPAWLMTVDEDVKMLLNESAAVPLAPSARMRRPLLQGRDLRKTDRGHLMRSWRDHSRQAQLVR